MLSSVNVYLFRFATVEEYQSFSHPCRQLNFVFLLQTWLFVGDIHQWWNMDQQRYRI
jgi:hypothetical protein